MCVQPPSSASRYRCRWPPSVCRPHPIRPRPQRFRHRHRQKYLIIITFKFVVFVVVFVLIYSFCSAVAVVRRCKFRCEHQDDQIETKRNEKQDGATSVWFRFDFLMTIWNVIIYFYCNVANRNRRICNFEPGKLMSF